jgi:hypothetical protein
MKQTHIFITAMLSGIQGAHRHHRDHWKRWQVWAQLGAKWE